MYTGNKDYDFINELAYTKSIRCRLWVPGYGHGNYKSVNDRFVSWLAESYWNGTVECTFDVTRNGMYIEICKPDLASIVNFCNFLQEM